MTPPHFPADDVWLLIDFAGTLPRTIVPTRQGQPADDVLEVLARARLAHQTQTASWDAGVYGIPPPMRD